MVVLGNWISHGRSDSPRLSLSINLLADKPYNLLQRLGGALLGPRGTTRQSSGTEATSAKRSMGIAPLISLLSCSADHTHLQHDYASHYASVKPEDRKKGTCGQQSL